MRRRSLYVETVIRTDPETLWEHTQNPALHQRWDLRFSRIDYLDGAPGRRFRYTTRIFGVAVGGIGVNAGERSRPDGTRVSALRFSSADPLSLIKAGAGYWRYTPTPDGVRFVTGFDYTTRWGPFGRLADLAFRPLFGWMTAWSFDRLRIWLETGAAPESQPLLGPSAARCRRRPARAKDATAPRLLTTVERP
ncbi:SRPBCC family protein [Amycolatopsis samaneae]|uniref:SRPBCC family protein n=1 Tax=Amycolatopsis samaneae TaxID=664691 RepID=A0ABW5GXV9_9PSEU